jgi:hypothetical protein
VFTLRTSSFSSTTMPWLLATAALALCRKSVRAAAIRACSRATRRACLRRLLPPFRLRASFRCARASARSFCLWAFSGAIIVPPESAANTATPRSIPAAGRSDGGGSATSTAYCTATIQAPARRATVRFFTLPGTARSHRSRTQPSFGSFTSPSRRDRRRKANVAGSGKRRASLMPRLRGCGACARPAHQFW